MIVQTRQYTNEPPPGIQDRVTRAGGRNIYGEPNFRIVWGPQERELLVGAAAWVMAPKYPQERWVVEMWNATRETPDQWIKMTSETVKGRRVERMGPYPTRGYYEHLATIEDKNDNYLGITPAMADIIIQLVYRSRAIMSAKTWQQRRDEKLSEIEREKQKYSDLVDDVIDNQSLAFGGVPWASLSSKTLKRRHV